MKKMLAMLLALVMILSLAACGSGDSDAQSSQPAQAANTDNQGGSQDTPEPANDDPMAALIEAAQAEGELVVYGSCEEDYLAAACPFRLPEAKLSRLRLQD